MKYYDTPGLTYDSGALYDDVTILPIITAKIMAKVKFTLKNVPDLNTLQSCKDLSAALKNNPNFPLLPVTLVVFDGKIASAQDKLTASDKAAAAAKQATQDKDTEFAELKAMAMQEVGYVDLIANGNASIILSAGLPVRAPRTPASVPGPVMNLSMTGGDNAGELDLQWDPTAGAARYEGQLCATSDFAAGIITLPSVSKSKTAALGLTSGAKMWARVRALNAAGPGAWSDVATKIVP